MQYMEYMVQFTFKAQVTTGYCSLQSIWNRKTPYILWKETCMCVCVCVCVQCSMHTCLFCFCVHACVCVCLCMCTCACVCLCVCVCVTPVQNAEEQRGVDCDET